MEYCIKEGWKLNPNKKIVEGIKKACERNQGHCPCSGNPYFGTNDDICPCKDYRDNNNCTCTLYVKI